MKIYLVGGALRDALLGLPVKDRDYVVVGATPEQMAAARAAIAAWNAANMTRVMRYWYIVYPFFGLFAVFFYGLSAGAQAFAYRALTEDEVTPNPR